MCVLPVEKDAEAPFGREKTTLEKVELIVILVQQTDAGGVSRRCPHGLDYVKIEFKTKNGYRLQLYLSRSLQEVGTKQMTPIDRFWRLLYILFVLFFVLFYLAQVGQFGDSLQVVICFVFVMIFDKFLLFLKTPRKNLKKKKIKIKTLKQQQMKNKWMKYRTQTYV